MYTTHKLAKRRYQKELVKVYKMLEPPPLITIDEWADQYRRLSSEASAEVGNWRTDRAPYQREMMRSITDPSVESVTIMTSSQVGKTEILLNTLGYYIHHQPSPILIVQPTLDLAQTFSKTRFAPMVRDCPVLLERVAEVKERSAESTILQKTFRGGHVTFVGSNSPSGLAGRPIRILLCDECDRYVPSAGVEGDVIKLAMKRTTTFWNRKVVLTSTPTVKGLSRIELAFESSDMRYYHVPCPKCGVVQRLIWGQVKWESHDGIPDLSSVHYECESCKAHLTEIDKLKMVGHGRWIATHPERTRHAGFHLSELYSPWSTWAKMVEEWYEAKKSTETLRVFINTSLGETWDDAENLQIDDAKLAEKIEDYDKLPEGVLALTCGIDVQDTYMVAVILGWGLDDECWVVDHKQILGSPSDLKTWTTVDEVISQEYEHENGLRLRPLVTLIDSGGHYTQQVYDYTKPREVKGIYACKGFAGQGHSIVGKFSLRGKSNAKMFQVGVDTAKEVLFHRLQLTDFGPGYVHFKKSVCDAEFFRQLTAEKQIKKFSRGYPKILWTKVRARNEVLDCVVYAMGALRILNPNMVKVKENTEKRLAEVAPQEVPQEQSVTPQPTPPRPNPMTMQRPRPRGNWVTNY